MFHDVLPDYLGFPTEGPEHLDQCIKNQLELAFEKVAGNVASAGSICEPVGPLRYHDHAVLGDKPCGCELSRMRGAQRRLLSVWGQS